MEISSSEIQEGDIVIVKAVMNGQFTIGVIADWVKRLKEELPDDVRVLLMPSDWDIHILKPSQHLRQLANQYPKESGQLHVMADALEDQGR